MIKRETERERKLTKRRKYTENKDGEIYTEKYRDREREKREVKERKDRER